MKARRLLPLLLLAALSAAMMALGVPDALTLDSLRDNRETLQRFVAAHGAVAAVSYVVAYAVVVALSLPGATLMTLAGGFLFGVGLGGALGVLSATLGASLLFVVARSAAGGLLSRRAGPFLRRMEEGFQADAFHYLLSLRLMPVFPFWAVNLVAAVLGMPAGRFVVATAVGIVPGTFVFAAFGAGLGDALASEAAVRVADVFSPPLLFGLVGLGLLALLPVAVRRWKEWRR